MINVSEIPSIVLKRVGKKIIEQPTFSLCFVADDGRLVEVDECICTSAFHRNRTINIRIASSGEIRKVRTITIIRYNGVETVVMP